VKNNNNNEIDYLQLLQVLLLYVFGTTFMHVYKYYFLMWICFILVLKETMKK
jgi:hypothetical protein